jgi:uncharacterized repeat protein (TIGR01451 family)
MRARMKSLLSLWLCVLAAMAVSTPALADLRSNPVWYDVNAVGTAPDWHYRVAITIPSGASINSTIKVDINFATIATQLGIIGTLDLNSIRVVRPDGTLAAIQEYNDSIFGGVTDALNNRRGEVRFILQDAGPTTYWVYFDGTENGTKPANPQQVVGGNFEQDSSGAAQPRSWNAPTGTGTLDAQVRPAETVSVTTDGVGVTPLTKSTDGNPNSGSFSYLIGARSANETTGIVSTRALTRTFVVPATNPGQFTVRWRPEGWDSSAFDALTIAIIGSTTTEVVGPSGNYATAPFSPNFGGAEQTLLQSGYGPYNGFDLSSLGVHTLGMAQTLGSQTWFTASVSLAAFAGQTVTLSISTSHADQYRSWFHIDDIEWSVVTATIGTAQGFGVDLVSPTSVIAPNQQITVRAVVDAAPTAATNPVTATILNAGGTVVASGILLFNDGTRGDVTANDHIWTNDGSDSANPTLAATTAMTGWKVRVFARDASTSSIGAQNGLIRGPGTGAAAETQANYWNIDEQTYSVEGAALSVTKTSAPLSDPVNGASNPKALPGAIVRYCITIANAGPATASQVTATDAIPASLFYVPGSMRSGGSCETANTIEDDDASDTDEGDGITGFVSGTVLNFITASISNAQTVALTFNAIIDDGSVF